MSIRQPQDEKNRFSEVVDQSLSEGPQVVTHRAQSPRVIERLLNAPRGEAIAIDREPETIRELAREAEDVHRL